MPKVAENKLNKPRQLKSPFQNRFTRERANLATKNDKSICVNSNKNMVKMKCNYMS